MFRAAYHRIDPKNVCRVEVTVNSYFSTIHGKKVYNRGRDVSWVVDSEKYSVINLEKDIASHFTWDSNQQMQTAIGEFLQRNFMVVTHSWLLFFLYSL